MTWQEDLIPASFGGAPFFTEAHEFSSGRRGVVHTMPQREKPLTFDLGRAPRRWRIQAFVVGEDYFVDRDRLVDACTGFPPGFPFRAGRILAHPYLGQVRAHCESIRLRESSARGRLARFEIVFVETGEDLAEPDNVAAGDRLLEQADDLLDQAEAAYAAAMTVVQVPEAALAAASAELQKVGRALQRLDVFNGTQAEVAALGAGVRSMLAAGSSLATSPANLVGTIRTTLATIRAAAGNAVDSLAAYESVFSGTSPTITGNPGGTAATADANAQAVADMTKAAALAGAAKSAAEITFDSNQDAQARRDALLASVDEMAESSQVPDAVYRSLIVLRGRIAAAVPSGTTLLEDVRTITLPSTQPALRVVYELFGSLDREQDFLDRNPEIEHPGFVPGGVELEALSGTAS